MNNIRSTRARQAGLNLIELMIVLVIIGLLGAIGYPSYQSYTRDARRTDAHVLLQKIAGAQERYFSNNNDYTADLTELGYDDPEPSDEGNWSATVTVGTGNFTITAIGNDGYSDPDCGEILLTSLGERRSRAAIGDTALNPPGTCW